MKPSFVITVISLWCCSFGWTETVRKPANDRVEIINLEQDWLHAHDAASLDRILAPDFVHVIPIDHFLTKQEHIDWVVKHPEPKERHTNFDKLNVRLYGDVGIVNGSVIATDDNGKELDRTMFTDVFVFRGGRWQAVNAQENQVRR
jgi:Domain of unknown function (DUF4440)